MVGAAIGVAACYAQSLIIVLRLGIIAVERAEVAYVQAHLIVDVPSTTYTNRIAVASKRCVLLVAIGQTVVGTLSTAANGKLLVDVVLYTC